MPIMPIDTPLLLNIRKKYFLNTFKEHIYNQKF